MTTQITTIDDDFPEVARILLATSERVVALPDATYQRWMFEVGARAPFSLGERTLIPIQPRSTYFPGRADYGEGAKALGLRRWELGVTPTGLIDALGLTDRVLDFTLQVIVPRCSGCQRSMERPRAAIDFSVPEGGYLVVTPDQVSERVSLREQCEMLGCERALVAMKIARVESLTEEEGWPIIALLASRDSKGIHDIVEGWFDRGGSALALYHAAARESEVVKLGVVSRRWSCHSCERSVEHPTRQSLIASSACGVCRGAGWLADRSGRLVACRECDGFGSNDDVPYYECGDTPLRRVAELSFHQLRVMVSASAGPELGELRAALEEVERFGFGAYPLASPVGTLSVGERVLLTTLLGEISRVTGARYVVDGASLREESLAELSEKARDSLLVVVPTSGAPVALERTSINQSGSIRLTEIDVGSLSLSEVEFPIGALSMVSGATGTGKSLLLAEIARRFSKRKKVAHSASFGALKRCHYIGPKDEQIMPLLALMSLDDALADEIARTRGAQVEGMTAEDLSLESARYRCDACAGRGVISSMTEDGVDQSIVCDECGGALYDWRVADLPLFGVTVAEVLAKSLAESARCLWRDPSVCAALVRVADGLDREVSLSSPSVILSAEERGFVALAASLARIQALSPGKGAQGARLAGELVLIDGPRVLTGRRRAIIRDLLRDLLDSGATVICADMPQGLESAGASVLRLRAEPTSQISHERRACADTRFARVSGVESSELSRQA